MLGQFRAILEPRWDAALDAIEKRKPKADARMMSDAKRRAFGIACLAGPVAQHWDQKDRHKQEDMFGPSADGDRANAKSESELREWLDAAVDLGNENCHHIRKLALALQQRGTIMQDEVWDLLTQRDPELKWAA